MINRLFLILIAFSFLVPSNVLAWTENVRQRGEISPPVILDCDSDPKGDC